MLESACAQCGWLQSALIVRLHVPAMLNPEENRATNSQSGYKSVRLCNSSQNRWNENRNLSLDFAILPQAFTSAYAKPPDSIEAC